jgi:hypothetical protein
MEGVTATQPSKSQGQALHQPVGAQGLGGILGAAGDKPAALGDYGGYEQLIGSDEPQNYFGHMSQSKGGEQDGAQLLLHLGIGQLGRPFFGHKDNVRRGEKFLVSPKKFPEEAFYPVALYRRAHFPPHHQPQARAVTFL